MSLRRASTVSPLTGCFSKALPLALQSRNVPSSKPRFSGRPDLSDGIEASGWAAPSDRTAERESIHTSFMGGFNHSGRALHKVLFGVWTARERAQVLEGFSPDAPATILQTRDAFVRGRMGI